MGTVTAIGVSPIAAAILARIVLGEKPDRLWYPATLLALCGLCMLNMGGGETQAGPPLLPLLAGCCYACYFVFAKPLGQSHAPEHVLLALCAGSGALLLPVHFFIPPAWLLEPRGMGIAVYLGVVTAALAFSLTLAGLRRTPTAVAATLALIEPLGAACWGVFFLGEQLDTLEGAGMLLLFAGVALESLGKKGESKTPPCLADRRRAPLLCRSARAFHAAARRSVFLWRAARLRLAVFVASFRGHQKFS